MYGHPLTDLVVVVLAGAAVGALFGLLKALRGPVGLLAYGGLVVTLYAYYRMGDKYFAQGIWEISLACLAVMAFTLKRVPLLRTVLTVAIVEFGARINKTAYPRQVLLILGVAGAMIVVATFWTGQAPAARTARPGRITARSRPRPQLFDPYTGQRLQTRARARRSVWPTLSAMWRRARDTTRTGR